MAYKFQKGTANLSGSIKLDSGYDLLGAGSNDLGTSAANFAVGYISVLSASTVVSGAFFEGSGARLTNVAATDITTTGTSTDSDFYPLFVDTSAGESGETIRVHSTVAINPSKGKVTATIFSSSAGTGSFGGGLLAGNNTFQVDYQGATTVKSLDASAGGISNAGAIAGASTGQFTDVLTTADISSSSGKISMPGGIDVAALFTVSTAGAAVASSVSSSTGTGSFGGGISAGNEGFEVDYVGATTVKSLNASAGGITNAGAIAGATTVAMGGALTGVTTLAASSTATIEGVVSGAAGTFDALAGTSLALQSGGITAAGAVAGVTTLAMGGALTGVTTLAASSNATIEGVVSGAAGTFDALAGTSLALQSGGITAAGAIAGATTVSGSGKAMSDGVESSWIDGTMWVRSSGSLGGTIVGNYRLGNDAVNTGDGVKLSRLARNTDIDGEDRVVLIHERGPVSLSGSGVGIRFMSDVLSSGSAEFAGTISGSGALSVGAGATFAGAVNLQSGGITNAGVIAGTTLLTASTGLSGTTVYANKFYGNGAGISGLTMDPAGSDTNIQFNQNDSLAADAGFTYNGSGSLFVSGTSGGQQDAFVYVGGVVGAANQFLYSQYDSNTTKQTFRMNNQDGVVALSASGDTSGNGIQLFTDDGANVEFHPQPNSAFNVRSSGNPATATYYLSVSASGDISGSGDLKVQSLVIDTDAAQITSAGAATLASLNNSSGGITNAGSIAGATTISGSGALSVGAGATFAGAVNLQAGGITNAGAIAAATTISGSGALSVGAGATFAGAVNLQSGGITNAGVIAGTTLLTASTGLSGATVYANKFYGNGAGISGLTMDPAGSDTNIQFNQNDSLAADTGFYYNGTGSFVVGEGKSNGANNTGMFSRFTASADSGAGVFGGIYLGGGTIQSDSSYLLRGNFGAGIQSIWREETGGMILSGATAMSIDGPTTMNCATLEIKPEGGSNVTISASVGNGTGYSGLDIQSTMEGGAGITATGGILVGHEGGGVAAIGLSSNGYISGSQNFLVHGTMDAAYGGFTVDADGDTVVRSLDVNSGGITEAGAVSGVTTISGSGAVTVDSITLGQAYSISSAGAAVLASLNNSSGGITNAGSIAGATTITGSGALSVGAGATFAGAVNLQVGGITNAGAIAGATTVNASSAVTAGTLVTNTLSRSSGDLTVQLHDASTNNVSFRLAGGSMPLRVLSTGIVQMNGGEVLIGTSTGEVSGSVAKFDSLSASADVVAGYYYGNGSNLTGISSDAVDVTSSTSNRAYGLVFTEAANSVGGLGLALQLTGATFNPATAALSGSGALTFDSITVGQGYSISSAGAATLGATSATTITGSGALSIGAGATLAGALNMQNGGITNAGAIAGATTVNASSAVTAGTLVTNTLSRSSGDLTVQLHDASSNSINFRLAGGSMPLKVLSTGVIEMNAGEVKIGASTGVVSGSGAVTADSITLGEAYSISSAGAAVVASLNVSDGNITNVGDINCDSISVDDSAVGLNIDFGGATTLNKLSLTDNLADALNINQGGTSYLKFVTTNDDEMIVAGKDLAVGAAVGDGTFFVSNGGIDWAGQKTLTASVNLDEAGESGIYHYHSHYLVSGSSAVTINLPSLENGYSMWFKRHPSMTANVTIAPSGSTNNIDGVNDAVVLETAGASLQLVGSGSKNWYIY